MDIDEIQTLWKEDSQIDEDNLHGESTRIPSLHAKYHQILNKMVLLKIMEEYNCKKIVFSSSATVYSSKCISPITEDAEINPNLSCPRVSFVLYKFLNGNLSLLFSKTRFVCFSK